MKRIKLLTSLALFIVVLFTSCSSDTEPLGTGVVPDPVDTTEASFVVNIDGTTYRTNEVTAFKAVNATSVTYILTAHFFDDKVITVQFSGEETHYDLGAITEVNYGQISLIPNIITEPSISFISFNTTNTAEITGQINVTANDVATNNLSGNFTAKVYKNTSGETIEDKQLSEGIFSNIHYTVQ